MSNEKKRRRGRPEVENAFSNLISSRLTDSDFKRYNQKLEELNIDSCKLIRKLILEFINK